MRSQISGESNMRIAVLGAGDMGTAITTPIAANGHDVRLWGTPYDDHIVAALHAGQVHPRLQHPISSNVKVFSSHELVSAISGADLLIFAVSSGAVDLVLDAVVKTGVALPPLVSLAKGLWQQPGERVQFLSARMSGRTQSPVVVVGGPAKANEVAMNLPTVSVFASDNADANSLAACLLETDNYRIQITADQLGVELAAAMKNAYAIAVGVATGMELVTGFPHQNLKAALFPAAIQEMARMTTALGGRSESISGLSGVGDLMVTVSAGRNRLLGEMLGRGQPVSEALAHLADTGMTIEGHAAVVHGYHLIQESLGQDATAQFPLLEALHAILFANAPVFPSLWAAVNADLTEVR
jgi:glycerol-3-phosphate dehydrogenase (NAD(P)+)